MIIDYNLHLEKKRTAIFSNKFQSKQIIKNISFLAKDKVIYYYNPSRKLENFLENFKIYDNKKKIDENSIIIFDGVNNFFHLSKIKNEILKLFPNITFFGIFSIPNFTFVISYFHNIIINKIKYSYRKKLKMIYIKIFKTNFKDFDDLKLWMNKQEKKSWIIHIFSSKSTYAFNFKEITNNIDSQYILPHEIYLDYLYS